VKVRVLNEDFRLFLTVSGRAIVEKSLSSKEFYKRMHWFTLWQEFRIEDLDTYLGLYTMIEEGKWTEKDYAYWYSMRMIISIAYLCDCEDSFVKLNNNWDINNVKEAYEKLLARISIIGRPVRYDKETCKYDVSLPVELPAVEKPVTPFPDAYFSTDKIAPNSMPRITSRLFTGLFNDIFYEKVSTLVEVK
jgi:hypothetical protein